jgi:phenylpropionate dioxygenase-like ring-hydroxylating dioxygenase large terminal subunit
MATRGRSSTNTVTGARADARMDVRALTPDAGLKEYWYPAIEAFKVGRKPVGMKICGEQLVFFRGKGKGEVSALANICPHRGGSLMHGDCHYPGTLSCPYHGWTFDGEGNVLAVLPEGPDSQVPGKIVHRSYPTQTLRGMVFVWMGKDDPAPIEEDVPPEFFTNEGQILYAWEVWPVNWRPAVENAGDAHVPYVHRDAAVILMDPVTQAGPYRGGTVMINDRAVKSAQPTPGANGAAVAGLSPGSTMGLPYRWDFPELGKWPKHSWRSAWAWAFRWAVKRRRAGTTIDDSDEWGVGVGTMHHLPAMVRVDYKTHMYTRVNVPIDEYNTRQIYWHYTDQDNWFAKFREKLLFHVWHRWALYSNFSIQDFRAVGPQLYDEPEYLSSSDSRLIMWRRLLTRARGLDPAVRKTATTTAEEASIAMQHEMGKLPDDWTD